MTPQLPDSQQPAGDTAEQSLASQQGSGDSDRDRKVAHYESAFFSGPLPPPEVIQEYENVLPGMADRIIGMVERKQEQEGRRQNQSHTEIMTVMHFQAHAEKRGQVFGLILGLVALGACVFLIASGAPVWGTAALIAEIAVLAGAFVWAKLKGSSGMANTETEHTFDLMAPPSPSTAPEDK